MQKSLVIQHVRSEGLGIIAPLLAAAGLAPDVIRVYKGEKPPRSIEPYSALIVLGGPMGVYEEDVYPFIRDELRLIESALKNSTPMLGVCLGSQLLAKAAGAAVYKGKKKEIGWYDAALTKEGLSDGLLLGFPKRMRVFQWHGDTFDVPKDAVNLASTGLFPNQLIKVGRAAYGVQFHLEVTEAMIKDWLEVNSGELKSLKGEISPARILKETPENIAELHRHGAAFIKRFLRLAGCGCTI
ncbi:MAG: gamma-glutamyl-gamma-aminobutyrate hydrolase family protein [Deltaproteobacteria bacterium]|nr:gamma-glutamyl-gamma-aminobutyrate hydrolase family protein [Deltaproteobacteria bacterium]